MPLDADITPDPDTTTPTAPTAVPAPEPGVYLGTIGPYNALIQVTPGFVSAIYHHPSTTTTRPWAEGRATWDITNGTFAPSIRRGADWIATTVILHFESRQPL